MAADVATVQETLYGVGGFEQDLQLRHRFQPQQQPQQQQQRPHRVGGDGGRRHPLSWLSWWRRTRKACSSSSPSSSSALLLSQPKCTCSNGTGTSVPRDEPSSMCVVSNQQSVCPNDISPQSGATFPPSMESRLPSPSCAHTANGSSSCIQSKSSESARSSSSSSSTSAPSPSVPAEDERGRRNQHVGNGGGENEEEEEEEDQRLLSTSSSSCPLFQPLSNGSGGHNDHNSNDLSRPQPPPPLTGLLPLLPLRPRVAGSAAADHAVSYTRLECSCSMDSMGDGDVGVNGHQCDTSSSSPAAVAPTLGGGDGNNSRISAADQDCHKNKGHSTLILKGAKNVSPFRGAVPAWLSSPFKSRKSGGHGKTSSSSSVSSASPVDDDGNPGAAAVAAATAEDELEAETRRILSGLSPSSGCWPNVGNNLERQRQWQQQLMNQDELLKLYILKLEEEANYFKATSPVDDEFCACPKCQNYYVEYYARYLEEFERQQQQQQPQLSASDATAAMVPLETSIFMDDIMNNGMTLCSIM